MSIGKASDFKIYQSELNGGVTEVLQQNGDVFNAASNGAIRLTTMERRGDYHKESFFDVISGLVTRQDTTSTSSVTPTAITQDEFVSVKLHRRLGPIEQAKKAFKMIGKNPREMSFVLGQQMGQAMAEDMVNTSLSAVAAALANVSALKRDITSATVKTTNHTDLLRTLSLLGDKANRVKAFVMHSIPFYDLGVQSIADQIPGVSSDVIQAYKIAGFGIPIIVSDSSGLIVTGDTPDSYYIVGLQAGAVDVEQSEELDLEVENVTGNEQLTLRWQGEYAYNLGLKGFRWDVQNGGSNPDSSAVGTGTNWDKAVTADKNLAGVILKCQAQADQ